MIELNGVRGDIEADDFVSVDGKGGGEGECIGARAAVILGSEELARGVAQVKDLETGAQSEVPIAELPMVFSPTFGSKQVAALGSKLATI